MSPPTQNAAILCMGCMAPDTGAPVCPHCGWRKAADAGSVLHLAPGTILNGCYLVGRVLGQSAFAITYLGWDLQLQRKITIQEYFPQAIASRAPGSSTVAPIGAEAEADFQYGLESFKSEGRKLARFGDHPCIAAVLNLFEANNTAYSVIGYLEGTTLTQFLAASGGKLSWEVAVQIMMRVMDGLREVHAQEVLHRDISPDNIYLTREGPVKILNFSAARFEAGERSLNPSVWAREGYSPEEQYLRRGNQGPWTDVYATAATLYRSITGVTPPPALDRLHGDTLKSPRALGAAIPPDGEATLMRALAVRAGDRFQSIESFQEALQGKPKVVLTPKPPSPAKWIWIGVLLLVVVIMGLLIHHKIERDQVIEAQRQEEERARTEADRVRREAEAAEAERTRQAAEAKQREQQSVAGAEELSTRFDVWLKQRRLEMGAQSVTVTFQDVYKRQAPMR